MTKVIIVVFAVILLGGGAYYFLNREPGENRESEAQTRDEAKNEEAPVTSSFRGSFDDLMARGGSYKCTFTHKTDVSVSSGTVYISDDRMRGDFESETEHMDVTSHMIKRDGYVYSWSPLTSQGFKMPVDGEGEAGGSGDGSMSGQSVDLNQEYDYDCSTWTTNESVFALPAITFMEIGSR